MTDPTHPRGSEPMVPVGATRVLGGPEPVAVTRDPATVPVVAGGGGGGPGSVSGDSAAGDSASTGRSPRRWFGRRPPAPPAHWAWRYGFPVLLLALTGTMLLASYWGAKAVLHSKQGTLITTVTDPTLPGYRVQVVPTPTELIVQTDDGGNLVGCVFASLGADDKGGTVVVLPNDLVVLSGGENVFLWKVYKDEGEAGVEAAVGRALGLGFGDTITVTARDLATFMTPSMPFSVTLQDPVINTLLNGKTETLLKKGTAQVRSVAEVQAVSEIRSPGETTIPRSNRQVELWQSWLESVQQKGGASAVGGGDTPLATFLRKFASGNVTVRLVPYTEAAFNKAVLLLPDTAAIKGIIDRVVPLPTGTVDQPRVLVELLNGTTNKSVEASARVGAVSAGGQVVVVGNSLSFDVASTSVVYYDEAMAPAATKIAQALGASQIRYVSHDGEQAFDVTVTIGADFRG
jgi:hypothetical protein